MSQQINDNFQLLAALSLDDRYRQPTISARDAISSSRRYEGMLSFVQQTGTLYMLINGILNSNWKGIAGADTSNDIETIIQGFYVLSAGKQTPLDWEVGDKFRGWIGNRYVVGTILSLPVSLPSDIDNTDKVQLAVDTNIASISGSLTENYIPISNGAKSITDSLIYHSDSGGYKIGSQRTTYGQGFGVSILLTELDKHIFDDYSVLTPAVGGNGFGTFDASTQMNGSVNNNHFMAYQSRLLYSSSGNLTDNYGLTGLFVFNSHLGTGTITNAHGVLIEDAGGDIGVNGNITNNYGIKIRNIKRGLNNFAIDSEGGDWRLKGDLFNTNSKGFYSYSQGFGADANTRYSSFLNDGNSHFYTGGKGTFQAGDFLFSAYQDLTQKDLFLIKASNGNIGIGTLTPTTYGTLKTVSINGTNGSLIEFKINDVFKGYMSFDANSMDLFNSNNTPIKFITNSIERGSFSGSGDLKVNNLSGTGDRNVIAGSDGTLKIGSVDSRPYKVYTAYIIQTGTSAPVATVLENTIGAIVWSRLSTGTFQATLSGAFVNNKTYMSFNFNNSTAGSSYTSGNSLTSTSICTLATYNNGVATDLISGFVEIRVYN